MAIEWTVKDRKLYQKIVVKGNNIVKVMQDVRLYLKSKVPKNLKSCIFVYDEKDVIVAEMGDLIIWE